MAFKSKFASADFWSDTADRAISTFAQGALASGLAGATGILEVDLLAVASVGGLAALVSVLQAIAFRGRGEELPADEAPRHLEGH